MPETRTRKRKGDSEDRDRPATVDMVNKNSNHAPATNMKQRKVASAVKKVEKETKGRDKHKETFQEDDEVVDMEIKGSISSDGEIDSDNEDTEEEDSGSEDENEAESEEDNDDNDDPNDVDNSQKMQEDAPGHSDYEESESEEDRMRHEAKRKCKTDRRERRATMEKRLDTISSSLQAMQTLMLQKGMLDVPKEKEKAGNSRKGTSFGSDEDSETTVYQNAVQKINRLEGDEQPTVMEIDHEVSFNLKAHRESSSSDDRIDTSDKLMDIPEQRDSSNLVDINATKFIAECEEAARQSRRVDRDHPGPTMHEGERIIRQAEAKNATLYATPGNQQLGQGALGNWLGAQALPNSTTNQLASTVDENYLVIRSHVDAALQQKIVENQYVDFAQLLPKNKVNREEDHRMEIISKGGLTYFVPVADRETSAINSFAKWEQAFRVFSNIFTRAFPHKATELIQYNYVIFTATNTYYWDEVYTYDREFRMHISNFPHRSWAVILQQAWSMYLKNKISESRGNVSANGNTGGHGGHGNQPHPNKSNENCKRYNKGKCPNGALCRYQHRCDECGKFGHGAHICRRRKSKGTTPQQETARSN